jgi:hypothetical protein
MIPFSQSQSIISHRDILGEVLKDSNAELLRNVRATCNLVRNDSEITKMQEHAQRVEALESLAAISIENIPKVIDELDAYKKTLMEKFSDISFYQIVEIEKGCKEILGNEYKAIYGKVGEEGNILGIPPNLEAWEIGPFIEKKYAMDFCVNKIKDYMLEQAVIVAEFQLSPNDFLNRPRPNAGHHARLSKEFLKEGAKSNFTSDINDFLKSRNMLENVAAEFSSQLNVIHAFLKERQMNDFLWKDLFIEHELPILVERFW